MEVGSMNATLSRAKVSAVIVAGGLMLAAPRASAHHSFSAEFDVDRPVVLRGPLTKMEWLNPHGWVYIDVKQADGTVVNWAIETGGPNALLRRGLRRTDFPTGIEVVVTGFQAKDGTHKANGRTVTLPDGRDFFLGSSGTGAPKDGADREEGAKP
jgi:Family of unknown function (DUF6152)